MAASPRSAREEAARERAKHSANKHADDSDTQDDDTNGRMLCEAWEPAIHDSANATRGSGAQKLCQCNGRYVLHIYDDPNNLTALCRRVPISGWTLKGLLRCGTSPVLALRCVCAPPLCSLSSSPPCLALSASACALCLV